MNYLIMDKNQNTMWVADDSVYDSNEQGQLISNALPWAGETGLEETLMLPNGCKVYAIETESSTVFTFLDENGAPTDVIDDARSIESLVFMANARVRVPYVPEHYKELKSLRSLFNAEYATEQLHHAM